MIKTMIYQHLKNKESLPWLIARGIELIGTKEIKGFNHNPVILKWAAKLGMQKIYTNDEIPWCGLFVAHVCALANKQVIVNPLWARNWAKWGRKADVASLGDILVFARGSGGHVGFYVAEDKDCYHVLGGNQSDMVNITRILKSRCIAVRMANYNTIPLTRKTHLVTASGKISTNEA
jgi:uncharacterized protein (TIGR02594 family)